jgi:hypothetical protein
MSVVSLVTVRRWSGAVSWAVLVASAGLAVAACRGDTVSDVYTALDGSGVRRRTAFYTDTETIFCVAVVTGAPSGTTVNAKIRQLSAQAEPVDLLLAVGEDVASGASTTVAFELQKPADNPNGAWPVGQFRCEIYLDGIEDASTSFEIQMPDCPLYPVATGDLCAGYYPANARCLAVDQTKTCVCDPASGNWQC